MLQAVMVWAIIVIVVTLTHMSNGVSGGESRILTIPSLPRSFWSSTLTPHPPFSFNPNQWIPVRLADEDHQITFHLALKHNAEGLRQLEERLYSISDPQHPAYTTRSHLSHSQVLAMIAPPTSSVAAVRDWLIGKGVSASNIHSYGDALKVVCQVGVARKLLDVEFFLFTHLATGKVSVKHLSRVELNAVALQAHRCGLLLPRDPVAEDNNDKLNSNNDIRLVISSPSVVSMISDAPEVCNRLSSIPGNWLEFVSHWVALRSPSSSSSSSSSQSVGDSDLDFLENGFVSGSTTPLRLHELSDSLAQLLSETVTMVEGDTHFESTRPGKKRPTPKKVQTPQSAFNNAIKVPSSPQEMPSYDGLITPQGIRNRYSIFDQFTVTNSSNIQAVGAYGTTLYDLPIPCGEDEVESFRWTIGDAYTYPPLVTIPSSATPCIEAQWSCNNSTLDEDYASLPSIKMESCLDVQYISTIGRGAKTIWWGTRNWMWQHAVDIFHAAQNGTNGQPLVHSLSYGYPSSLQCVAPVAPDSPCSSGYPSVYIAQTNAQFLKINNLGITIVVASGDSGASGSSSFCQGTTPDFPAESPYVLSVGATMFDDQLNEVVCSSPGSSITSGGGFSCGVAMPAYQQSAVQQFLSTSTSLPPSTYFCNQGRAYPDVAALGNAYLISLKGACLANEDFPDEFCTDPIASCSGCSSLANNGVSGTSASCPVVAGMITLLNDWKLRSGRPPIGFINPLLYRAFSVPMAYVFTDITSGNNNCGEGSCTCNYGFTAQQGWDAASGLGSILFNNLYYYVCSIDVWGKFVQPAPLPQLADSPIVVLRDQNAPTSFQINGFRNIPSNKLDVIIRFTYQNGDPAFDGSVASMFYNNTSKNLQMTVIPSQKVLRCGCTLYAAAEVCGVLSDTVQVAVLSCCKDNNPPGDNSKTIITAAVSAAVAVLVIFALIAFCRRRRARAYQSAGPPTTAGEASQWQYYPINEPQFGASGSGDAVAHGRGWHRGGMLAVPVGGQPYHADGFAHQQQPQEGGATYAVLPPQYGQL